MLSKAWQRWPPLSFWISASPGVSPLGDCREGMQGGSGNLCLWWCYRWAGGSLARAREKAVTGACRLAKQYWAAAAGEAVAFQNSNCI
jgi:hypothetical protein